MDWSMIQPSRIMLQGFAPRVKTEPRVSDVRLEALWHLGPMVLVGVIADRAGHAGCSAATLPRPEPRPIGMGLADPSTIVASRTELHGM